MAEPSLARELAGQARRFRAGLADAVAKQAAHLMRIVQSNKNTAFGRQHGFAGIDSVARFAEQVPIRTYDALEPWITRAANGATKVLTDEAVIAFEETGGSTGGAKLVPITAGGLGEFQAGLRPWLDDLIVAFPALATGSFYWSISPACRPPRATRGATPIGLGGDAAYFGEALAPSILRSLAVSPEVAKCSDFNEWRERTLAQLLHRDDLAMISVWSPTFLTQLLEGAPHTDHSKRWPRLRVISCWDQAAAAPFAQTLRDQFPHVFVQGKGLLATEGLVTIPLVGQTWPVISPTSGYYEFKDAGGAAHGIDGVRAGQDYDLVITNASGFYRYAIGDRVRVHGFVGEAPTLEFLGRGVATTDLCGEKLVESFVIEALRPLGLRFCALALDASSSGYVLLLDADEPLPAADAEVLQRVERELDRNPQYAYARCAGQLKPLRLQRLDQPVRRWTQVRQGKGQRLGDIKPPALIGDADLGALLLP